MDLTTQTYLVSSLQLDRFRHHGEVNQETDVKAEKGAYFISDDVNLSANEEKQWMIAINVNQDSVGVAGIIERLKSDSNLSQAILKDIDKGNTELLSLVSASDGIELSADKRRKCQALLEYPFQYYARWNIRFELPD